MRGFKVLGFRASGFLVEAFGFRASRKSFWAMTDMHAREASWAGCARNCKAHRWLHLSVICFVCQQAET